MADSPAEQVVLLIEQRQGSPPHGEPPEPRASQEYSPSPRLRPLHQGLVGRQSVISTSMSLILPVLFGLVFGLGHHFFYRYLDGRHVDSGRRFSVPDQQWVGQIGIAFVFLTKTCFSAAISTAFVQQAWMTVSQKPLPLSGIDSLWSILRNPMLFTSVDMLAHAKIATILALAAWIAPLASIPSTSSLRIVTQTSVRQVGCMVPSVDLSNSSSMPENFYFQWDLAGFLSGSPAIESLAARVLIGGSYISWPSPCGYNCTYNITYTAPKYRCSDAQANGTNYALIWQATDNLDSTQDTLTLLWTSEEFGSMVTSSCTPYNATYRLKIHYVSGVHGVDVLEETTHDPISTLLVVDDGPANLAGVKDAFLKGINGSINDDPIYGVYIDSTLAGYTKMANISGVSGVTRVLFFENVPALIEDYMRNMSISLLATTPPPPLASASCLTSTNVTVYQYKPTALLAGYGALFLASLLSAVVGGRALFYLGGGGVNSFSLVVSTTRNRNLDALFIRDGGEKATLSQKPRFKYDMIEDEEGNLRYAFRQEVPSSSLDPSEVSSQTAVESQASSNTSISADDGNDIAHGHEQSRSHESVQSS